MAGTGIVSALGAGVSCRIEESATVGTGVDPLLVGSGVGGGVFSFVGRGVGARVGVV